VLVEAAISGLGLAYVWEERAAHAISDGALISCLDGWCQPEDWLHLYYPTRKYMSAGLRALIQAMRV
jgi:DNA-binding transcriptional LysR family regulator